MQKRWSHLWQKLGTSPPAGVWEQLVNLYNSPDRYYHNLTHLEACWHLLDLFALNYPDPRTTDVETTVALALWFHDAIYDSHAADNEQLSADLAKSTILQSGLSAELADRVDRLILATGHHGDVMNDLETQLLLDIDLGILGSDSDTFWTYEHNIRQEYAWVPWTIFQQKRMEILQIFLDREFIYQHEFYRARLEAPARQNLTAAIAQLANK
jgi:predicted metal-dependent HD superfamily phosphohydrolase